MLSQSNDRIFRFANTQPSEFEIYIAVYMRYMFPFEGITSPRQSSLIGQCDQIWYTSQHLI